MSDKYSLVSEFKGYQTKPDETNTDERYLTAGSFNVLVNDEEKVTGRLGYELVGSASEDRNPGESSFTWETSSTTELTLRGLNNKLQVLYGGDWVDIAAASAFSTAAFGFPRSSRTGWWSNAEGIDILPFVAKDANLYGWNGAIGTVDSLTLNTITLTGLTLAEQRYYTASGNLVIDGTVYAYTGTSGNQFTGVTPNPVAGGVSAGDVVSQQIDTNADVPGSGLTNDIVDVINNQVYVGDYTTREVFGSTTTDYTDFTTISAPREPGEAMLLTLDSPPTGFVVQEDVLYITGGQSNWYQVIFSLTGSTTGYVEDVSVKKLKTAPLQAAKEKDLIANIKNSVVYISNEPTMEELGRIENINTPQAQPLSDPIKPDFAAYDFSGGDVIYYDNQVFIAVPEESLVLIYDLDNGWWQPPQKLSIAKFSVYQGKLLGHSSLVSETYELFKAGVRSDNTNVVDMQAVFAYRTLGDRALLKQHDEYFTEGYISPATTLNLTIEYDYQGATSNPSFTIKGTDTTILKGKTAGSHLGSLPLGGGPLGSSLETESDLKKFRVAHGMPVTDYWEYRAIYSTTSANAQFQLLSHGPQVRFSPNQNNHITK